MTATINTPYYITVSTSICKLHKGGGGWLGGDVRFSFVNICCAFFMCCCLLAEHHQMKI